MMPQVFSAIIFLLGVSALAAPALAVISPAVIAGGNHSAALKPDGSQWAWGSNDFGQLGDGSTGNLVIPTAVAPSQSWLKVAKGSYHTVAIRADGTLWAWGRNFEGQFGNGSAIPSLIPVQIGTETAWKDVAAGGRHTLALKNDGTLWGWGANDFGQLGRDLSNPLAAAASLASPWPVQHPSGANWSAISAGENFSVAIDSNGKIYSWGANFYGQLGNDNTTAQPTPDLLFSSNNWVMVSAGREHVLAIDDFGQLWGWGSNLHGEVLGEVYVNYPREQLIDSGPWLSVAAGGAHSVGIRADRTLWGWGSNLHGQLGLNDPVDNVAFPRQVGPFTDWVAVAAGSDHTIALRLGGEVLGWGSNAGGQVGNNDTVSQPAPVTTMANIFDTQVAQIAVNPVVSPTSLPQQTLSGRADPDVVRIVLTLDTAPLLLAEIFPDVAGAWSYADLPLQPGTNVIGLTIYDAGFNISTTAVTIVHDNELPSVTIDPRDPTSQPDLLISGGYFDNLLIREVAVVAPAAAVVEPVQYPSVNRWTCQLRGLTPGSNPIAVTVTDLAGNVGPVASASVIYDNLPPAPPTVQLSGPVVTNLPRPEWTWSSSEGTLFQYRLDDGFFSSVTTVTSFIPPADLPEGTHTLEVRVSDVAGNWSAAASAAVTVDQTQPAITLVSPTAGLRTKDPLLAYVLSEPCSVEVFVDDLARTERANDTLALADGAHQLQLQATDAAGNVWTSALIDFTVDTQPPLLTVDGYAPTNVPEITLSGTFSVGAGDAVTVTVEPDSQIGGGTATLPLAGRWIFQLTGLTEGVNSVTLRAVDLAGNVTVLQDLPVVYDSVPPSVTVAAVTSPTNQTTQLLQGTREAGSDVEVATAATLLPGVTYPSPTQWTCPVDNLQEGVNTFSVIAVDAAGNTTIPPVAVSIVYDSLPPQSPLIVGPSITNLPRPTLSWSSGGGGNGIYRYRLDNPDFSSATTQTLGTSFTPASDLPPGNHVLYVQEQDLAGNWSTSGSFTVLVDLQAPVVAITSLVSPTGQNTQVIAGTRELDATVTVTLNGVAVPAVVQSGTSWSCVLGGLLTGANTVLVTTVDSAGNFGSTSANIQLDDVPPPLTFTQFTTPTKFGAQTIGGTVEAGANVSVTVTPGATFAASTSGSGWSAALTGLLAGSYQLTVTATDAVGNSSQLSQTIVVDTEPPAVSISPLVSPTREESFTLTGTAESNATVAVVVSGGTAGPVSQPAPGNWACTLTGLSNGAHTVTVTAIDAAGNPSTRTVLFEVDTLPPALTVVAPPTPSNLEQLLLSGTVEAGATVVVTTAPAANVGPVTLAGSNWSCTIAALTAGNNSFTVTATDRAGNVATAPVVQVVYDATAPLVTLAALVSPTNVASQVVSGTVEAGTTVEVALNGTPVSGVLASGGAWSCTLPPLVPGNNLITVRAVDSAANVGSVSSSILYDNVAPTLTVAPAVSPTNVAGQTLSGTLEPGSQLSVQLNGVGVPDTSVTVNGGSWSAALEPFSVGLNTVLITAVDVAGNQTSRTITINHDTTPPALTLTPPLSPTNQTGQALGGTVEAAASVAVTLNGVLVCPTAASGAVWNCLLSGLVSGTNDVGVTAVDAAGNAATLSTTIVLDTTPPLLSVIAAITPSNQSSQTLSGTVEAGATVTVTVDTAASVGAVTVLGGDWNCTVNGLVAGTNLVTVTAADSAGNTQNAQLVIEYDTVAPAMPTVVGAVRTNVLQPLWTWNSGGGGNGTFRYSLNDPALSGGGTVTTVLNFTPGSPLTEGSHTLYVQERDATGNWSGSGSFATLIDLTAPQPPAVSGPTQSNSRRPVWTWVSGGGGSGNYRYKLNDSVLTSGALPTQATSFTPDSDLADGVHTLYLQERDEVGNWSTSGARAVIVDTVAPVLSVAAITSPTNQASQVLSGTVEADAMVTAQSSTAATVGAVTVIGGTWSCTVTGLVAGLNTITLAATDAAGNVASGEVVLEYDLTPPSVPTVSGAGKTNLLQPQWFWTSGGGGNGIFRYKLDDANLASGATETTALSFTPVTPLLAGSHTLYVQEQDAAGNWSFTGFFATVIDLTAPSLTVNAVVSPITTTFQTISGTVETGATVALVFSPPGASSTVVVTGNSWSADLTGLAPGINDVTVTATDLVSNQATETVSILVDGTPPNAPLVSGLLLTRNAQPQWRWVSGGGGSGGYRYKLDDFDLSLGATETTALSFVPAAPLPDGAHMLYVQERDVAGNWSPSGSFTVTIDGQAPAFALVAPLTPTIASDQTLTGTVEAGATITVTVSTTAIAAPASIVGGNWSCYLSGLVAGSNLVTLTATDAAGNRQTLSTDIVHDGVAPQAPLVNGSLTTLATQPIWNWSSGGEGNGVFRYSLNDPLLTAAVETSALVFSPAGPLAEGSYTLYVQERDAAGNWSPSGTFTTQVDLTGPPAPVVGAAALTNNPRPPWGWSSGGGGSGLYRYKLDDNDLTIGATETTAVSFVPAVTLSDGAHVLYVQERDVAGNWSASGSFALTVDTVPPLLTVAAPQTPTNLATQSLSGTVETGAGVVVTASTSAVVGPVTVVGGNWSCPLSALTAGTNLVTLAATDAVGNRTTLLTTIVLDQTSPLPPTLTGPSVANTGTPTWSWSTTGGGNGNYRVKLDSSQLESGALLTAATAFTPPSPLADGNHTLYLQEQDAAGNWSSTAVHTIRIDTRAPVVAMGPVASPTRLTSQTLTGTLESGSTITLLVDTAALPGIVNYAANTWSCLISGFVTGTNLVTITETDLAGNATSLQVPIVFDGTAPALTIVPPASPTQASSLLLSGTREAGVEVLALANPAITLGPVEYPDAGQWRILADGLPQDIPVTVVVAAADAAGNRSERSVTLLRDLTPPAAPVLSAPSATQDTTPTWSWQSGGGGNGTFRSQLDDPLFGPAATVGTMVQFTPAVALVEGQHTLYVQEQDVAGNWSASAAAAVTVDLSPPLPTVTQIQTPTAVQRQVLSGSVEPGATISLVSTGAVAFGTVTYPSAGAWSCPIDLLQEGTLLIVVNAVDPSGNAGSVSVALDYDVTAPTAPRVVGTAVTSDPTPTWSWSSTGGGSGRFRFKLGDGDFTSGGTETLALQWTPTVNLVEGTYLLYVQEQDAVGNWSAAGTFAVTIDLTAPLVSVDQSSYRTAAGTLIIGGTLDTGATLTVLLDGINQPVSYPTPGRWEAQLSGLLEGDNFVDLLAVDVVGNGAPIVSTVVTLDTTAPQITLVSPLNGSYHAGPVLLDYAVSDGTIGVLVDGVPTVAPSGTTLDLPDGSYRLTVSAFDDLGNLGALDVTFVIDRVAPVLTLDAVATPTHLTSQLLQGDVEADLTVVVSGSGLTIGAVEYPTPGRWRCLVEGLQAGANQIDLQVEDLALHRTNLTAQIFGASLTLASGQIDGSWQSVALTAPYVNPVVITGPVSRRQAGAGLARLRNLTANGFEWQFASWQDPLAAHAAEAVPYLVLETGRYVMPDGAIWDVGTFTRSGTAQFSPVSFAAAFAGTPQLYLTVQSAVEGDPVVVRMQNLSATGFEAALFEAEGSDGTHLENETIGYLAIYQPAQTGAALFAGTSRPYLLQNLTHDAVPFQVLTSRLAMEEEQTADSETAHATENVAILSFGGQLFAQTTSFNEADPFSWRSVDTGSSATAIEWGTLTLTPGVWHSIPLAGTIANPVVVASPLSLNASGAGFVQTRNVTATSFDIRYGQWEGAATATVDLFYLVAEPGQHTFGNLRVEAGTTPLQQLIPSGWTGVPFIQAFPTSPAVFASLQTAGDPNEPAISRCQNISAGGFEIGMQEHLPSDAVHAAETVGWIAVETGLSVLPSGQNLGVFSSSAGDTPVQLNFGETFAWALGSTLFDEQFARLFPNVTRAFGLNAYQLATQGRNPVLIVDMASTFDDDPAVVRFSNLSVTGVMLQIEEQPNGNSAGHASEQLSVLLLQ